MKKLTVFIIILVWYSSSLFAQKYISRTGQISFSASTPLEDIRAVSNEASGIIDLASGDVVFEVLIKSFKFKKALMQEHFNENYMESDRYPKANFKGKIADIQALNLEEDGSHTVPVNGKLTIHGVERDIATTALIKRKEGRLDVQSQFKVKPQDYNIKIPALVSDKIAKEVSISVKTQMQKR